MGVVAPKMIHGTLTTPFAGTTNDSDPPEIVCSFVKHVTRARTRPKFAGTFGSTHELSASGVRHAAGRMSLERSTFRSRVSPVRRLPGMLNGLGSTKIQ